MIQLPIDKNNFVKFLSPISKLGDKAVIKFYKNKIYTITSSEDNNIILYASISIDQSVENLIRLNISDIKKLLRAIECFEENLTFYIKDNYILSETQSLNSSFFKYYLVDDSVIRETPISIDKISNLNFDTIFTIDSKKISEIARASMYAYSTNKIYLYTKENSVFCELTDHEIQNTDSITLRVSDTFTGAPLKDMLPLVYEIFRNLTSLKNENVKVKINNEYKIIMFVVNDTTVELKYIISTLIK